MFSFRSFFRKFRENISLLIIILIFITFFYFADYFFLFDIRNNFQESLTLNYNNFPSIVRSELEISDILKQSNVRIFIDNQDTSIGGSGVIIARQKNTYFVITNSHVINQGENKYQISTFDNNIYKGKVIKENKGDIEDDLALIKFVAKKNYFPISISKDKLIKNQVIFASGFPFQDNLQQSKTIYYTKDILTNILHKPLMGGYQLGYTNLVHNGMSGGSIVNQKGALIGINGLGKYPILGNPYIYQDGISIDIQKTEEFSQLSWGIPIKSIENFLFNK